MEGKAEKTLKDFGKRIDSFMEELNEASSNLKDEFSGRFDELKKSKDSLSNEFRSFKEKNQDKWDEVETSLEKAGEELKNAFQAAFKKQKNETKDSGPDTSEDQK